MQFFLRARFKFRSQKGQNLLSLISSKVSYLTLEDIFVKRMSVPQTGYPILQYPCFTSRTSFIFYLLLYLWKSEKRIIFQSCKHGYNQ